MNSSSYEDRILALDERLQLLWEDGSLSQDEYNVRSMKIIDLKENLFQEQRERTKARRPLGVLETKLFHQHWRDREKLLSSMLSLAKKVYKASESANCDAGAWQNIFRLSRLRKILGHVQNLESQLDFETEQVQALSQSLLQHFHSTFPETQQFSLAQLLRFIETLDTELKENHVELQDQEADLRMRRNHFLQRKELAESAPVYNLRQPYMLKHMSASELIDE